MSDKIKAEPRPWSARDEIAITAMQGIMGNPDKNFANLDDESVARFAYKRADAMLAEREVQQD